MGPRSARSLADVSCALWSPVTALVVWQKKQVTPRCARATSSRFVPSFVAPSCNATGAWHRTQTSLLPPSRTKRAFMARKIGSSPAYACMLPDHSRNWFGWHVAHFCGSSSCARSSCGGSDGVDVHATRRSVKRVSAVRDNEIECRSLSSASHVLRARNCTHAQIAHDVSRDDSRHARTLHGFAHTHTRARTITACDGLIPGLMHGYGCNAPRS